MPAARSLVGLIVGVGGAILQLIFGLLMLSAAAPTSMAEERQRGSLDLLAATTLSTPTIVLGKWLGTLRQVALLAIGPGLLGLALALAVKAPQTIPPGTPGPVLRGIVRRCAALRCLPPDRDDPRPRRLDRERRPGARRLDRAQSRAIALSVGLAVIVGAGWPILVAAMRHGPGQEWAWRA